MAAYTPQSAITFAKTMVKSMPLDDTTVSYQIADYVAAIMWMAAPWSWTLDILAQTPLVAATTDYAVTLPADFGYLAYAYYTDGASEVPVHVDPFLPAASNVSTVTKVAVQDVSGSDKIRVHPKPGTGFTHTLVTVYKKVPTKITSSNFATAAATGVPDQWFWVYQLGVLWLAYHYADDARAGVATLGANGQTQYTGFLGAFQSGLDEMRKAEPMPLILSGGERTRG